jgi:cytochrome b involved in lipid metabolism
LTSFSSLIFEIQISKNKVFFHSFILRFLHDTTNNSNKFHRTNPNFRAFKVPPVNNHFRSSNFQFPFHFCFQFFFSLFQKHDTMQKNNLISLQELWRHNTESSCWIALHGVVYDVTNWLSNHPGGKDLLLASAGRDATQLFEMYHPFIKETEYMKKQLEAFRIGTIRDYDPHYLPDSGFYQETAQRVWKHLREKKIDPKGVQPFLISFLTICSALLLSYLGTFFLFSSFPLRLLCAVIFGAFSAIYEIHPKHDISHGVLVRASPLLHHISVLVDEFFIGGSSWAWLHQHVIGHHVFTNKAGLDPDVPMPSNFFPLPASLPAEPIVPTSQKPAHAEIIFSPEEFRRISPLQPKNSRYYLQHLYIPVLYAAVSLKSRFEDITWTFMGQANGPVSVAPIPIWRWTKLILSKSSYIFLRLVLPLNFAIQQQGGFSVVPLEEIVRTFFSETIPLFLLSEAIMGKNLLYVSFSHVTSPFLFLTLLLLLLLVLLVLVLPLPLPLLLFKVGISPSTSK